MEKKTATDNQATEKFNRGTPGPENSVLVFDQAALKRNRDRVAAKGSAYPDHNFLFKEVANRLYDKFLDIRREFHTILDLGCHGGELTSLLKETNPQNKIIIGQDLSRNFLKGRDGHLVQGDEEILPYQTESLDLVLSNLSLHWVNDLPGCLHQIRHSLKPDGLFLAAVFGGETLTELRQCLMEAEIKVRGGVSPRISPYMDIQDAGSLLQRAGFSLPVVDTDRVTVTYENTFKLMNELKGMGEANILTKRSRGMLTANILAETAQIYQEKFTDPRGRIIVTFDVIYLMGWAPHESQQKPLKPGQGKVSLTDVFGEKD